MKFFRKLIAILLPVFLLTACGSVNTGTNSTPAPITESSAAPAVSETPSPSVSAKPALKAQETPAATPVPINDTGKTLIRKDKGPLADDTCILFISKSGQVLACDPMLLSNNFEPNYILVTHDHHANAPYYKKHPDAQVIQYKKGTFELGDFKVTGIPASHNDAPIDTESPKFVVYLIEVDGLRLAYFACCGQTELTKEQLEALGQIDVACITTDEYVGFISVAKATGLMKQLNPKIIIPLSHGYTPLKDAVAKLQESFGSSITVQGGFAMDTENIDEYAAKKVINIDKSSDFISEKK